MRSSLAFLPLLVLVAAGCVSERFSVPPGLGSFSVEITNIDAWTAPPECVSLPLQTSPTCVRPFPELETPVNLRLRVTALDRRAQLMTDYAGTALVDVRPGRLVGVGPAGLLLQFAAGVSETDVTIAHAYGAARLWVEDCGSSGEGGSFATGISPPVYFDRPTLDQLNATTDNTTSPLTPRPSNVCAITGDPRYGLGANEEGELTFVGYSRGRTVNAPPPAMGNFVELVGCGRDEYDQTLSQGGCRRGPLVVTAIGNEGFYTTDLNGAAVARGFNHLYSFNFNYPDDLEVGDIVVSLRGSPVEFAGSTQLSNPVWRRDGVRRGQDLLPAPVTIDPATYLSTVRTYGRNRPEVLTLERLEGALVCMDNLAPASTLVACDVNQSGGIERQGCLVDMEAPLPPRCDVAMGSAPRPPHCRIEDRQPYCFPLTEEELLSCALQGYIPDNPGEYCCERNCYDDPACNEESSYLTYGQWVADVFGNYERQDAAPVKIAVISRDARPDFDVLAFAAAERLKPAAERRKLRVIGNLRQVLAARPVWVIIARVPTDVEIDGSCP